MIFRSILATWPLVQNKLRLYLKTIKRNFGKNKGSFKDPLLYLGAFSVILFSTLSLGADFILKPRLQKGDISFLATVSDVFYQPSSQFLFTYQKTKTKPLDLSIIQNNSIIGNSPPQTISSQVLGSLIGSSETSLENDGSQSELGPKKIIEYAVQADDTFSLISEKFGISIETILWANDLNKNSFLKLNQKLIILPVSGLLHYIQKGDTLGEIASTYKADIAEIIAFNELSNEGDIYIGDILIVPHGKKPVLIISPQVPLASSYFICPIAPPCIITQGLHWSNAIDFSNGVCGSPIYAAAGGQVVRIKYGWNLGAGNYLTILHPNGVVTMYGHLQSVLVNQGDTVLQGQIIALMGGKPGTPGAGNSTGCHLHFGVQGARNPFAK